MMNAKSPIAMVMGTASVANVNVSVDIKVPRAKKVKCSISILIMPFWHPKFMAMFHSLCQCALCAKPAEMKDHCNKLKRFSWWSEEVVAMAYCWDYCSDTTANSNNNVTRQWPNEQHYCMHLIYNSQWMHVSFRSSFVYVIKRCFTFYFPPHTQSPTYAHRIARTEKLLLFGLSLAKCDNELRL